MNKFKKVVSSLAVTAFVMGAAMPIFASPFTDVADTAAYKDSVVRLSGLGIMEGSNGTFRPDDNITRAEVTKVLEVAMGYGKILKSSANQFTDVDSAKWYAGAVNFAANIGLVKGYTEKGKKVFKPEDNVTYAQFATLACRALGYKDLDGQWPYNYIAKANELGLFNNVDEIDADAFVKRSDIAVVSNAMMDTTTAATVGAAVPKTLFDTVKDKLKVTTVSGIVTAVPSVDSTLAANHVKIGDTDYEVATANPAEFMANMGKTVSVYVKSGKIVFLGSTTGTSTSVTASKAPTATELYYKDSALVEHTLKLDSVNLKFFLNGKAATAANIAAEVKAGAAVTLVNTDDNTADTTTDYEYAIVNQYQTPVVVAADVTSDDAKTVGAIGSISLMKDAGAGTAAQVTVTGAASKLSEIKKNDVIYAEITEDKSVVKLTVVRNMVSGIITATTVDGSQKLTAVTINGKSYGINCNGLAIGQDKDFVIDKDGNIIQANDKSAAQTVANTNYGVLTATAAVDSWGTTTNYARIIKTDGTTVEVKLVDGTAKTDAEALKNIFVYYTVDATTGIATVKASDTIVSASVKPINIVSDTKIYAIDTTGTTGTTLKEIKYADIDWATPSMDIRDVVKVGNTMGDYAMLVVKNPNPSSTVADTTGFGYIVGKTGTALVNSTIVDVYNVYVNGTLQTINVTSGYTLPSEFSKLTTTNGIVTSAVAATTVPAGTLQAKDASRLMVGGTIYNLDANVKMYTRTAADSTVKVSTLADLTADATTGDNVTIVRSTSASDATVIMVIVNK